MVKNWPANTGDERHVSLIPGSGRSPGVANGTPHKYSCLENSMDRGAWQATVHRVTQNPTWLSTTTGKALYASSKYQIKKTSRNKSFEFSAQNSLHEDAALFHLESGSLECPGETGISFPEGPRETAITRHSSCQHLAQTARSSGLSSQTVWSTQKLVLVAETRLLDGLTQKTWYFSSSFPYSPFSNCLF